VERAAGPSGTFIEDAEPPPAVRPSPSRALTPRRPSVPNPAAFERHDDAAREPSAERRVQLGETRADDRFFSESKCLRRSAPYPAVSNAWRPVSLPSSTIEAAEPGRSLASLARPDYAPAPAQRNKNGGYLASANAARED
jgi:hypothetical protein